MTPTSNDLNIRKRQSDDGVSSNRSTKTGGLFLKGGKWRPHDLRRTGATMMTGLGVPEVAERCLNHTEENKVKRTYQRHSYSKEMPGAWSSLDTQLKIISV